MQDYQAMYWLTDLLPSFRLKTVYICENCEYKSPKWLGKCPSCGSWNSFVENEVEPPSASAAVKRASAVSGLSNEAVAYKDLELPSFMRSATGLAELDRVLGGGLVVGSAILLAGEPGIGKSTLLLQICENAGKSKKILYVSCEESAAASIPTRRWSPTG